MKIRTYLVDRNISQKDFCKKLGIVRGYFRWVVKGNCSLKIAHNIEKLTNGEVKAIEICPDLNTRIDRRKSEYKQKKHDNRTRNQR